MPPATPAGAPSVACAANPGQEQAKSRKSHNNRPAGLAPQGGSARGGRGGGVSWRKSLRICAVCPEKQRTAGGGFKRRTSDSPRLAGKYRLFSAALRIEVNRTNQRVLQDEDARPAVENRFRATAADCERRAQDLATWRGSAQKGMPLGRTGSGLGRPRSACKATGQARVGAGWSTGAAESGARARPPAFAKKAVKKGRSRARFPHPRRYFGTKAASPCRASG